MSEIAINIDFYNKICSGTNAKLIGVSKTKPVEMIREAYNFGLKDFGENKVQELISKINCLPKDINWHFIGHLQTNKVKLLLENDIFLIHSVDSLKLAQIINKYALLFNKTQNILLEINVTGEETKSGYVNTNILFNDLKSLFELKNINIVGLMCVAKKGDDCKKYFNYLNELKEQINKTFNINLTELSMGMTDDYIDAIECGSTYIRIGRGIFGDRI